MKHVILIFEKFPGCIFQKNILEGGAEVSLMIGLLIGIMVGVLLSRFIFREKPVGSLRVDESDPDSGPYLFLELDRSGADAIYIIFSATPKILWLLIRPVSKDW